MVIAVPAASELEGPSADDHRSGGHELVHDLAFHTRQMPDNALMIGVGAR